MELLSIEFLSALAAVVVIDLVLAGDNAIVIALAARSVPMHLRNRAIVWGTVGAIVVRTAMTMIVVWLLKIPGLMLMGGLLLVWIAYKLLANKSPDDGHTFSAAGSFWGAMGTIVVADAVMGVDNVLAVAGASQGSFLLVVMGLMISIPIVIGGTKLILNWVDRFPAIIYIGGAVLAWTAAKMITSEPLMKEFFTDRQWLAWVIDAIVIIGVLGVGFLVNSRRTRSGTAEQVNEAVIPILATDRSQPKGEFKMLKILLPIDGSSSALQAVRHVISQFNRSAELHLLHVRKPFSRYIARFMNKCQLAAFHRDEADKASLPARALLDRAGVPYAYHVVTGDKAKSINSAALRLRVNRIVMGTARRNSLTRLVEDSVTNQVMESTRVPIEVIAGDRASRLEQYGLPFGIGLSLGLLLFAAD